jgi:voltage-gated potassium channel
MTGGPDAPRPEAAEPFLLPPATFAERVLRLSTAAAAVGVLLIALGVASAAYPPPELYRDAFSGYDPPFSVVAGILLIALAPRVRERAALTWLFSLLAPVLTCLAAAGSLNAYSLAGAIASVVYVGAVYPYRSGFYRGVPGSPTATELAVIVTGLLSLLLGTVGARWLGEDFAPPVKGWAEALYFTVSTISTNGSSIEPITNGARLFVVALILLGVGTFLSAIVVLFLPFLERRLSGLTARLERAHMQELERHVLVCGASPEAVATARALRVAGARTVIVSPDSKALELLRSEGFRTHLGDPSVEDDLRSVGIERAQAMVVAQASDAENLLTVITARAIHPGLRIVAIASSDSSLPKLRRAGANEAVSVVSVAAQLMSSAALETGGQDGPHSHTIPG